jgi:[acyl-carrier-protein] S-malonyltransferase
LSTLVECGPGKVLAGMTKRIVPEMQGFAMFDPASLTEARATIAQE